MLNAKALRHKDRYTLCFLEPLLLCVQMSSIKYLISSDHRAHGECTEHIPYKLCRSNIVYYSDQVITFK